METIIDVAFSVAPAGTWGCWLTRLLFAAVANACNDVGEGGRIEKVKLTIVNFKMDGRGSAEKDASEND
ncbi:hypothetical protein GCM10023156_59420 [Novipirellula rosea]|uniref:Uncharacterized protein n=1 Tax=Novipirellula rosea TaxID=1031540 RepID=A0ABP8NLQ2_9BACT